MLGASTAAGGAGGLVLVLVVIYIAIVFLVIAGFWKSFKKAGVPGWGAIIPIYNLFLMTQIAKRPGWWVVLMFIPLVNIVTFVILMMDISVRFGKGQGFGLGLAFLSPIFWPILGFGSATYSGTAGFVPGEKVVYGSGFNAGQQ